MNELLKTDWVLVEDFSDGTAESRLREWRAVEYPEVRCRSVGTDMLEQSIDGGATWSYASSNAQRTARRDAVKAAFVEAGLLGGAT